MTMVYLMDDAKIKNKMSQSLWQALQLYSVYRVILAITFVVLAYLHIELNFFGVVDELLFQQASALYLFLSLSLLILAFFFKHHFEWQSNIPIFADIIVILILMHASGGIISGLGILLVVVVAAHSLLVGGKLSLCSGAVAAIGLFIEHSYTVLSQNVAINMYTQVGLLGIVTLTTSLVTNILSAHARKNQLIIESQAQQLATSQQLNAYIVSAMHAGVLVLDNLWQIRLINAAAKRLLGNFNIKPLDNLDSLPQTFQQSVQDYLKGKSIVAQQMSPTSPEVRFTFHPLGQGLPSGTLIFLYDIAEETRHAQDLKLASLGHLTANIAHELRNPLGAASHATQLLAETSNLSTENTELLTMIKQSCDRMNTVIKNVLSLSGRKAPQMQTIQLIPWLEQFIRELVFPALPTPRVKLEYVERDIQVNVDPSQLAQILINLCENGLRYSFKNTQQATLIIRVQTTYNPNAICVDIIDQGQGIPSDHVKHIFEPFFTTENTGSGLGLYIARELSQMNGARLDFYPISNGCQFRITLYQQEESNDTALGARN